jgi:hypothetical protein
MLGSATVPVAAACVPPAVLHGLGSARAPACSGSRLAGRFFRPQSQPAERWGETPSSRDFLSGNSISGSIPASRDPATHARRITLARVFQLTPLPPRDYAPPVARKICNPYPGAVRHALNRGGRRGHSCRRSGPAALPANPGVPGQADLTKRATALAMPHSSKT